MRIAIFRDAGQADHIGAEILIHTIREKNNPKLGLATGSSPVGIYKRMVDIVRKSKVSLKHVSTYNLDEYVGLSKDHPHSYAAFMEEHLFRHVDILPEHVHIPSGTAESVEKECIRYEELLRETGNLDIQLLGIGLNGHIGFNEPGEHLSSETHLVTLTEETRSANAKWFHSDDQIPRQAITMGVGPIMKAGKILFIASGEGKSNIIKEAFTGPLTTRCPASFLQLHPDLIVLLDEEAAAGLTCGSKPSFRMNGNKKIEFLYDPNEQDLVGVV
ncbi:glucosamine-6-phosphate deaminase [Paenibacillus sp. FJAT-27812]|uniref:glucosamine-6-phosphate deaminase n=1 Tax=Paenibacillus sp. FJAT-27812 TaxID=1684143 RepID=UPI0007C6345C|nr:glucosamine-6-phosphate deaminase [Paenibacillus sp. FJAT-27812]